MTPEQQLAWCIENNARVRWHAADTVEITIDGLAHSAIGTTLENAIEGISALRDDAHTVKMTAHIIAIAEAHAHIAIEAWRLSGEEESQGILNGNMSQIIDLLFNGINTDLSMAELERTYHDAFWRTYHQEWKPV